MEEGTPCREQCKYQRDESCALERCDAIYPVYGAACCDYLLDDEFQTHC
jgi:hypothetical protein